MITLESVFVNPYNQRRAYDSAADLKRNYQDLTRFEFFENHKELDTEIKYTPRLAVIKVDLTRIH